MERSVDPFVRPVTGSEAERSWGLAGRSETVGDEERLPVGLLVLLAGEIAAYAALSASGNMPEIVSVLYRALLTL
ncbi:MAG: hypothetical protein KJ062_05595 [Thermoanaerobaculia bacterium]|nr:hypothetical protein [Thermoanaerobaculia bacterium]